MRTRRRDKSKERASVMMKRVTMKRRALPKRTTSFVIAVEAKIMHPQSVPRKARDPRKNG